MALLGVAGRAGQGSQRGHGRHLGDHVGRTVPAAGAAEWHDSRRLKTVGLLWVAGRRLSARLIQVQEYGGTRVGALGAS